MHTRGVQLGGAGRNIQALMAAGVASLQHLEVACALSAVARDVVREALEMLPAEKLVASCHKEVLPLV